MRRNTAFLLPALLALAACSPPTPEVDQRPRAGQPLDSVELAARITKVRAAAVLGRGDVAQREMEAMHKDLMRSMKVADASRPIDREAARAAARTVPGVHSVVWIDRHNLLAMVDTNDLRSQTTIDAICQQLEPLGDTLAVVVHLQSRAARTGDELETINRNCQLAEGDHALFQQKRQLDVIPPEIRAEHAARKAEAPGIRESQQAADDAMKVLEASTPEM